MTSVLEAVYGAYVIDWADRSASHRRLTLGGAAPRRSARQHSFHGDPEARGLAACIELSARTRNPARWLTAGRAFVPLADQDPSLWDPA